MRLSIAGNTTSGDLRLLPGGNYNFAGSTGRYAVASGMMTFLGGPLDTSKTHWVGQSHAAGSSAAQPTIAIRTQADVAAGNSRDLQWCNLAR